MILIDDIFLSELSPVEFLLHKMKLLLIMSFIQKVFTQKILLHTDTWNWCPRCKYSTYLHIHILTHRCTHSHAYHYQQNKNFGNY